TNIFVGNASNVATGVAMSGDATLSNAGALTIANSAITDAKVSATAAIAVSKLAAVTASRALASDASGKMSASSVTSTELGYLSGVTSAIQTQISGKFGTTLSSGNLFVGNASNVATGVAMSGDATLSNAGALTIANSAITDAKVSA